MKNFKKVIKQLKDKNRTISCMESCTGGFIAHSITNIEGASDVFSFGAVTYSNEFKIKMGVSKETIEQYTVYSIEVARSMAHAISHYSGCDYGIGVTGKLNREDVHNPYGSNHSIYVSIYDVHHKKYYDIYLDAIYSARKKNKEYILDSIVQELEKIV